MKKWENKILRMIFRPKMKAGEWWVEFSQEEDLKANEGQMVEDEATVHG